ncbi:hypothetical protein [Streptomyces sp. NPDC059863]
MDPSQLLELEHGPPRRVLLRLLRLLRRPGLLLRRLLLRRLILLWRRM